VPNLEDDLLTVHETAILLARSTEQVRRYLREGVLPGQRLGGQWFVTRNDAQSLLRRRQRPPEGRTRVASPDPLDGTIAIGQGGGGSIAAGKIAYLCSLATRERP
jgi:hypothetical protein